MAWTVAVVFIMNYALTDGVNCYQMPGNDLRGCVHDVASMKVLLGKIGFSVMHVRSLINEQATKQRILDSLKQMVVNAKKGDHLVWHHSSHGAQVPDTRGDEPDGMTEILCPYDFDWVPEHYIADDEVHDICTLLDPGATLDILLDACHSGDMLREIGGGVPKFIPYPGPLPVVMPKVRSILQDHTFDNVCLWSGCRSDQTSADACINGIYQGAFTWAFCNSENLPARKDIIWAMQHKLADSGYEQEPEIDCCENMKKARFAE